MPACLPAPPSPARGSFGFRRSEKRRTSGVLRKSGRRSTRRWKCTLRVRGYQIVCELFCVSVLLLLSLSLSLSSVSRVSLDSCCASILFDINVNNEARVEESRSFSLFSSAREKVCFGGGIPALELNLVWLRKKCLLTTYISFARIPFVWNLGVLGNFVRGRIERVVC